VSNRNDVTSKLADELPASRATPSVVAPNFHLSERASGLLLHPTSLPGPHGNGDIGPEARRFVDFLASAGQRWWQMLPVNPVGPGFSPYSGVSAFAGNPLLISLHALVDDGLLEPAEIAIELGAERARYDASTELRQALLRRAYARYRLNDAPLADELRSFRERTRFWLADYTLFMAIKHARNGAAWTDWDHELAKHDEAALSVARAALADELAYFEFEQFVFDRQWLSLRAYAAERGVGLIGDAPIFISHDSSDVWGNQASFRLDDAGQPTVVSGVPPDYFSETGQRWGTPLYRWRVLKKNGYRFWVERFRSLMQRFDVIRLDHFIGFARYWEIPATEETAVNGRWVKGPGQDLFDAARRELGVLPFIAEDLGSVTSSVKALRRDNNMPGMRVLQFAFNGDPRDNQFLPHHYVRGCVAYTGTHDNDTTVGWFGEAGVADASRSPEQTENERKAALRYLAGPLADDQQAGPIHLLMLRALFASVADTVVAPVQDLLGLGSEARMNTPGIAEGNWLFRVAAGALTPALADRLRALTEAYGRLPKSTRVISPGDPTK
jgi:4-alpha-glucanotransferase